MPDTNDTIKFSLQRGGGTAIKSYATAKNKRRTSEYPPPPLHPTALAVNKSLAVFMLKYVLSDLYRENRRGSDRTG